MRKFELLLLSCLCLPLTVRAADLPAAIAHDPAVNRAHPPFMASMEIVSHGEPLNSLMYVASGPGPHPTAILLSGFPGNERNLDLAQAMRRAGWNALYFNYRGSWGTPGSFSFTHCLEDTGAVLRFLRDRENDRILRVDPKRIVLIGHSLGGFIAAYVGAHDPGILGVGLISAANPDDMGAAQGPAQIATRRLGEHFSRFDLEPLSGCTPFGLAQETISHRSAWNFHDYMALLATRPVLIITADDGLGAHDRALARVLTAHGNQRVTSHHFSTDHSYSADRIGLEAVVIQWLNSLLSSPPPAPRESARIDHH